MSNTINQQGNTENPSNTREEFNPQSTFKAEIKAHSVIDFLVLETSLPPDFINLLNTEIDSLLAEENVKDKDFSGNLVGQIKNGAQLALEKDRCDAFHGVYGVAESLAKEYAKRFMMIGAGDVIQQGAVDYIHADCYEAWTVHSFRGDYNPIHDHGNRLDGAMSFVIYTQVPPDMRNKEASNMKNPSGWMDGCISFVNGATSQKAAASFRWPKVLNIIPEVGKMIIFPHWLNHMVYPFDCDGERRSISGNITMMTEEQHQILTSQLENMGGAGGEK